MVLVFGHNAISHYIVTTRVVRHPRSKSSLFATIFLWLLTFSDVPRNIHLVRPRHSFWGKKMRQCRDFSLWRRAWGRNYRRICTKNGFAAISSGGRGAKKCKNRYNFLNFAENCGFFVLGGELGAGIIDEFVQKTGLQGFRPGAEGQKNAKIGTISWILPETGEN